MATRKVLSIKEKIEVIKVKEKEKLTVRELAKRFNIGKTQAAVISKNKEAIKAKWQSGINIHQRKSSLSSKVDKLCYDWFVKNNKKKGTHISGPILKSKAKEIADRVKYTRFSASNKWLEKWRKQYNITFNQINEELPSMLKNCKSKDDYGTDDSCLLFRALPDKSYELKSKNCIGGELSKKRFIFDDPLAIEISDSEEELETQTTDSINSYDEAFKQIARLKQFARDDFVSLQHLNKLEKRIANMQLKGKQTNK